MATTAVMLAGCSSAAEATESTDTDTAVSAAADAAVLVPAAPGELDPGPYTTTPSSFDNVTAGTAGELIESQRLAEFVTLPFEIDPELTVASSSQSTRLISGPNGVAAMISIHDGNEAIATIAEDAGFSGGFLSSRSTDDASRTITHAVLQFRDADAAGTAARQLHQDRISRPRVIFGESTIGVDYPIDGLTGSHVSADRGDEYVGATAFTPHGRHVIFTWIDAPPDREDWIAASLTTTLEMQRPLLDRFPATAPADLPDLRIDIDGVLGRTVWFRQDETNFPLHSKAVYGPRGAAHLAIDQAGMLDALTDTDITHMAVGKSTLYRSAHPAGAEQYFDRILGMIRNRTADTAVTSATGPQGVPNTRCFEVVTTMSSYTTCVVYHGRYVGEIHGADLTEAHQVTTAQYMLLRDHEDTGGS